MNFLNVLRGNRHVIRQAIIVGVGAVGMRLARFLEEGTHCSYQLAGFVHDGTDKQEVAVEVSTKDEPEYKVLGNIYSLPELIAQYGISALILNSTYKINDKLLKVLADSMDQGVKIIPGNLLYEQLTGRVPIESFQDNYYELIQIQYPSNKLLNRLLKRLSDIMLASLGIVCLAPFFPFIVLAIYLDSPGPIFYTQARVGRGGRIFKAYKFRSMVQNAEKGKAVWAEENDSRVTRVGKFLRKTHVDEFPQFLNILKGEMSAVGPRPERPEFQEELEKEIPLYHIRQIVKPGMAGWGLVKQGYAASKKDVRIKIEYDLYYIKYQSLWFDIVILFKTIIDTVTFRGR